MCGRFTLRTPNKELSLLFGVEMPQLRLRYNIAPSQEIATIRQNEGGQREGALLKWGLIPSWSKVPKSSYSTINARAETVTQKPAYRSAFKKRRCLILADGFYEWQKTDGTKQPMYIHMQDDEPFAFAGLWERWRKDDQEIESCTIIVTEANELMEPFHDRMPVILSPDAYDLWLDPEFEGKEKLQELLRPFPSEEMEAYPVSTLVNSPKNDVEECIRRVNVE